MALYTPVIQLPYMFSRFVDAPHWSDVLASGIIEMDLDIAAGGGEYVNAPKLVNIDDFTHANIGSDTPVTPTRVSSNDDKYPVIRSHSLFGWKHSDNTLTGEQLDQKLSGTVGEKLAKRALKMLGLCLKAATPSALTLDKTGQAPTLQMLRQLKFLNGDSVEDFNTFICHSLVWNALLQDLLNTYPSNAALAGLVATDEKIRYQLLGIKNIIFSDQMPTTAGGFSTAGDDTFNSFLCRPESIRFGYQKTPQMTVGAPDVTVPGTMQYAKIDQAFAIGPKAAKWTGSANPDDSAFGNASNWSGSYADAREYGIVKLISKATSVNS